MRLFHATSFNNVASIKANGLKPGFDGCVYLTDSIESAQRWIGFRLIDTDKLCVIEVEVDESKLEAGCDHSELMVTIFGVGKSLTYPELITKKQIKKYHYFQKITNK